MADARASGAPGYADLIGQGRVIQVLDRAVQAAHIDGGPIPHVLLTGGPGLGKSSMACATARELGTGFHRVDAPLINDPGVIVRMLTSLGERDVLFLDEIHRLPERALEVLYPALQDGCLNLTVSCGLEQRVVRVRLRAFTLIGATTEEHLLPEALRGRFGIQQRLAFYDIAELEALLHRAAADSELTLEPAAARRLARISRDTPREAIRLLQAVRTEATVARRTCVSDDLVKQVLAREGIDERGLRWYERRYLAVLTELGRAGLVTLAARLGESKRTIQTVYERYLIRCGLVRLTPSGRELA